MNHIESINEFFKSKDSDIGQEIIVYLNSKMYNIDIEFRTEYDSSFLFEMESYKIEACCDLGYFDFRISPYIVKMDGIKLHISGFMAKKIYKLAEKIYKYEQDEVKRSFRADKKM